MKEVKINAVLNGFTVKVGCQTMVYTDIPSLIKDMRGYLKDWDKKEKEILDGALNKKLVGGGNSGAVATYGNITVAPTTATGTWMVAGE